MFLDQHATLRTWLALAVRVGHRRLKVRVGRVSILAAPFSRRCRRRRRPSASGPGRRRTSAACTAHRPLAHIGRLHKRRTSAACTVGAHHDRPGFSRLQSACTLVPFRNQRVVSASNACLHSRVCISKCSEILSEPLINLPSAALEI